MKKRCYHSILIVVLLCFAGVGNRGFAQVSNYKAYAIFIYNFSKHTHYPPSASTGDFVITVLGKSKITEELNQMAAQKSLNGRKFRITEVQEVKEMEPSHLIFVSANKSSNLTELANLTKGQPTLIVTERDGLIKKGAHISFLALENQSLRFEINTEAVDGNHLQIAHSLLSLAYKE